MGELNEDRVRGRLNDISQSISRLRKILAMDREAFLADQDSQDIARSRLLTAIEAALNLCFHVAAKKLRRVPEEYAQCFTILAEANLISRTLAERLGAMARFRNLLVHLYWNVDYGQVYDILANNLEDLEEFAAETSTWV
jgi:uncharacterized protein YutE (UPF0331/DUF86 family)